MKVEAWANRTSGSKARKQRGRRWWNMAAEVVRAGASVHLSAVGDAVAHRLSKTGSIPDGSPERDDGELDRIARCIPDKPDKWKDDRFNERS